jgi:hypothetical protein
MFAKYNSTSPKKRKNKTNFREIGIGVIFSVLLIWCFAILSTLTSLSKKTTRSIRQKIQDSSNDNNIQKKIITGSIRNDNNIHKKLSYQEWMKHRQNVALKPLEPMKRLNASDVGKWVFRKTKDGKPHYFNKKTHEIKWITPPKNLQACILNLLAFI